MIRRCIICIAVLVAFPSANLSAQWVTVGQFDAPITSIYFLSDFGAPATGFVGLSNGGVWKTGDGGGTWIQVQVNASGPISSFTFKNINEGWLSTRQDAAQFNVFSTTDAGVTWSGVALGRQRPCVYYSTARNLLFATSLSLPSVVSADGGLTWKNFAPAGMNSIDFSDNFFGILTPYLGYAQVTLDGGFSWYQTPMGAESWKPLAVRGKHIVFAISESDRRLYRSKDEGRSWQVMSQLSAKPTGDIEGTCQQLYVQTDSGIYVSADEGISWVPLHGPSNQSDTRFVVVNQTIFAGDLHGGLFRFNDISREFYGRLGIETGSSGTLEITAQGCSLDSTQFRIFANSVCLLTNIDSLIVKRTRNLRVGLRQGLPRDLPLDSNYTFSVYYQPNSGESDTMQLHVYFTENGAQFDTTLVLLAHSEPQLQLTSDVQTVQLHARFTCEKVTGMLTLFEGKCDSLTIDSVVCDDSSRFSAKASYLPFGIAPRGKASITVTGHGESRGVFQTILTLYVHVRGKSFTFALPVALLIDADGKVQADITPTNVSFSPTSICGKRENVFYILNSACLSYKLISVDWENPSTSFQIISQPLVPRTLNSGDVDSVVVRFSPQQIGNASATIRVTFIADSVVHDTLITITGMGYTQSKARLSELETQFDTISQCELSDAIAYVRNESCDSTQIVEVIAPNDVSYVVLDPKPPIWVPPGDSVPIHVKLNPSNHAGSAGDHLDSVEFRLKNKGGSEQALDLVLKAYVLSARRQASLSIARYIDSSFTPCSEKDTIITLRNLGRCDTLSVKTLNVTGSNWFSTSSEPNLPVSLLPGDSLVVHLHINAAPDSSTVGRLMLSGDRFDTSIVLQASVHKSSGLGLEAIYRDTLFVAKRCTNHSGHVRYQNLTCGTLTIDSAWIADAAGNASRFQLGSIRLPLTLKPGDTVDFPIIFSSDAIGDTSATLQVRTREGRAADAVLMHGHITGVRGTATLIPQSTTGANTWKVDVGTVTNVELVMHDLVPDTTNLSDIHIRLLFDDNVLTSKTGLGLNGWNIASQTAGSGYLDLDLSRTNVSTIKAGDAVASIPFYCTLGDALSSSVTLQDLTLNHDDPDYKRCVLTALPSLDSALININPFCGDSLMLHVNLKQSILGDLRIIPNPVASPHTQIDVLYKLLRAADVEFRLTNEAGKELDHWRTSSDGVGEHRSQLNVSRLARGVYFLQVAASGERTVRKIAID